MSGWMFQMSSTQKSTDVPQQSSATQTDIQPPASASQPPTLQQSAPLVDGNAPGSLDEGNAPTPTALQTAAMAQVQAGFAIKSCENLAKAQARADRWTRDLKIRQVKEEFKTPADKKVIFAKLLFSY